MFTKLEQRSWITIEVARCRSTQECFQGIREYVAMQRFHCAQRHDVLKRSGKAGMPFRKTPCGEHHSTPCFPVGWWSPMHCVWASSESWSMSQNCVPHSAWHSGLPKTSSTLDAPWNFRGATMAPLCSRTGLVGPVPMGRWRLSRTNRRDASLWTKSGLAHKYQIGNANQMNGSIPVLLVQRKCALHNVLWRWCSLWSMTLME